MRNGARAFLENPLTWQDDEDRAFLVPILHELTRVTSFYGATATRDEDDWVLCWFGRVVPDGEFWFQQCVRIGGAGEEWVLLPCCPEDRFPLTFLGRWTIAPPYANCDAIEDQFFTLHYEKNWEPYGRWIGFVDDGGGKTFLIVQPTAGCGAPGQGWTVEVTKEDERVFAQEYVYPCGEVPYGWTMFQNVFGPCPGAASLLELEPVWP